MLDDFAELARRYAFWILAFMIVGFMLAMLAILRFLVTGKRMG